MFNFSLNSQPSLTKLVIGEEEIPLLIIDDFANSASELVALAGDGSAFQADKNNFYPGKRQLMPSEYGEQICQQYFPLFQSFFGCTQASTAKTVISAFALADTPVAQLRPMQMLPHIDTPQSNQFAVVHYLCDKEHGGTTFYRHRETGYERITTAKLTHYGTTLKQQAIAEELHKNPHYISQSTSLFEQLLSIPACMNRVLIYPSNLLHSGDINPVLGLSNEPQQSRLTITSLVVIN